MSFNNHSPDAIISTWNGINIIGYADDTFVEVERDEDGFTTLTGALGDVVRARSLNKTGKVTFTLLAASPTNDLLSAAATLDAATGLGYGPLQIKDLNGTMLCFAAEAWIMKHPKVERGREAGTVQWTIACAQLEIYAGGNLV